MILIVQGIKKIPMAKFEDPCVASSIIEIKFAYCERHLQ
jgi:hypothetical protein